MSMVRPHQRNENVKCSNIWVP